MTHSRTRIGAVPLFLDSDVSFVWNRHGDNRCLLGPGWLAIQIKDGHHIADISFRSEEAMEAMYAALGKALGLDNQSDQSISAKG